MSLFPEDAPYRVLARKYRPGAFDKLIGQDALVTTLGNAIRSNRLAQAWLLTGVRGVGKTSTARIIAKSLNCIGADGQGGPTIDPCGECANCVSITAGQHIDVVEMDAASNTSVDDVREIIEAVRYASVSARYKIYIIDEVHMLSRNAFNALLKTLEEPPPHVKFIFATTEVHKLPATILSRCQRFDLKRVPARLLADHFARIVEAEGASAQPEAMELIARAADGSVRDGLSILDQAIAMGGGGVTAQAVRDMLGLADRGRTMRLLGALLAGDADMALAELDQAHDAGVEPQALFSALLDLLHMLTRARVSGNTDLTLSEEDRAALGDWASRLGFATLHRLWQMVLKAHAEIVAAPVPRQAADMAALRIVHAAGMPDPSDLARMLVEGAPPQLASQPAATPPAPSSGQPDALAFISLFEGREAMLAKRLMDDIAILSVKDRIVKIAPVAAVPASFPTDLKRSLKELTDEDWQIDVVRKPEGARSLRQEAEARMAEARRRTLAHPQVIALMEAFPGAELVAVNDCGDKRSLTA